MSLTRPAIKLTHEGARAPEHPLVAAQGDDGGDHRQADRRS